MVPLESPNLCRGQNSVSKIHIVDDLPRSKGDRYRSNWVGTRESYVIDVNIQVGCAVLLDKRDAYGLASVRRKIGGALRPLTKLRITWVCGEHDLQQLIRSGTNLNAVLLRRICKSSRLVANAVCPLQPQMAADGYRDILINRVGAGRGVG